MIWALYGFLHSFFRAALAEAGRAFRADAAQLMFVQAVFAFFFTLPLMPFMEWPENGRFYFTAVIVGLIITVGHLVQLALAAQKTGRVSSVYMPLEALCATVIWLFVMPGAVLAYQQNMIMTAGLLAAFGVCTTALLRVRPHDANLRTLMVVAPVGLTFAVAGVATKMVMPLAHVLPVALAYVMVNFAVMAAVMGAALLIKGKAGSGLTDRALLKAGAVTGAFSMLGYATFVAGVALAPNPGYIGILAMLLPVWLLIYHKIKKSEDTARPMPAFVLAGGVAAALAIILFS